MRDALLKRLPVAGLVALGVLAWPRAVAAPAAHADASAVAHAGAPAKVARDAEQALLEAARSTLHTDPARALAWIERADADFGDDDEARRVVEIEARVAMGTVGHARALTRRFYARYPDSPAIPQLERLTGYHPR